MKKFLCVLIVLSFSFSTHSQNPDINLLKDINLHRNHSLDPTFRFITNTVTPVSIAAPVGYIALAFIKKDSASKSNAILVCGTILIDAVISTGLKYGVNRPRPFETYPFIDKQASGGSPSFPSGHTSSAFGLATSISMTCPKWYVITPAFLWAGAVGYSRMDLGVHYPSDVLAGAVIGSGSAYLSYKAQQWLRKRCSSNSR
jgi:membrane-associated phospholipid phosphatase